MHENDLREERMPEDAARQQIPPAAAEPGVSVQAPVPQADPADTAGTVPGSDGGSFNSAPRFFSDRPAVPGTVGNPFGAGSSPFGTFPGAEKTAVPEPEQPGQQTQNKAQTAAQQPVPDAELTQPAPLAEAEGSAPAGNPQEAAQNEAPAGGQEQTPGVPYGSPYPWRAGVPGSVGNPYGAAPVGSGGSRPAARIDSASAKKRSRSLWWIAPLIVVTLLLGIALGFLIHYYFSSQKAKNTTPAPSAQPSQGDLTGRIITQATDADYISPVVLYQTYAPSVVGIVSDSTTNVFGQETPIASSGTGFIISEDGYILTNYHVVEDTKSITVTLYNRIEYPAELIGYENEICDVALLKIDASGLTPVVFGDSDAAMVGEEVTAIGNPLGELTFSMTVGHLSAKERAIPSNGVPIGMLQTDTAINSGNSGGPLFDCTGAVIGIVTAKFSGETSTGASMEGLGFAIPINTIRNMLDDLQTLGYAAHRAYLGVRVQDSAYVNVEGLPHGAYVASVESGYCAEKAGIKAGDVIVGIDGKIVASYQELVASLQGYVSGQTVTINVFRNGEYYDFNLTLDARPQSNE